MSSPVEQIKARLNIVDVVQSYIKLQKAGVNFKALCPFHSEETPSFFVSPSREMWHCFGCGRSGDIFAFVMEIEGADFLEALKILADRAGVEIKPLDQKYKTERHRLLQLMEEARNFYEAELKKNKDVIEYLKSRGLKGETAKSFRMGFAPSGWRNIYDFLKTKNYSDSEIEKSGMIIKSEKGLYDRFRNRIIFPFSNASGQTIGFSGRIFNLEAKLPSGEEASNEPAKYINSPQTILFDKSKFLYGFDKAKEEIRKKDNCIAVEGQMDVIMSHQAGIKNTVAVSGTSLTSDQLQIIKRLTENITFAFDKDEAGIKAAQRGIDMALARGFEIKVAIVPSGKDPADIIQKNPEEWKEALKNSKHIIEFCLDSVKNRKEVNEIVLPYLAVLPSAMEKAHWVKEIARRLSINEESVWEDLRSKSRTVFEEDMAENFPRESKSRLELLKERLIGFILWQRDTADQELKNILERISDSEKIKSDNKSKNPDILIFEAELFYAGTKSLKDELNKLFAEFEKEEIKTELLKMSDKIRELEHSKNEAELDKFLKIFHNLSKRLNELK